MNHGTGGGMDRGPTRGFTEVSFLAPPHKFIYNYQELNCELPEI